MQTSSTKQRMVPFIVSLSFFMEAVDSTILNTAIPVMSQSLHVYPVDLKMALISYLLSLAIFIPISGWLADKYGSKNVFIYALTIFTLSSLWCGFAENLTHIVIARFIQGFGGALGLPVGRLIIIRTFGQHQLISRMNQVVTVGALGIMLGPFIGGYISTHFAWHWIFWVNVPIGVFAIFLALYWLTPDKPKQVAPLDRRGFVLFSLSLSSFTFSLSAFSESNINPIHSVSILCASIVLFVIYGLYSRHQPNPIVKTDLFFLRTFRLSIIGALISRIGFGGIPFLVPLLLQVVLGYSAQASGALLIPIAAGVLFAKRCAIPMLRFFGFKSLLLWNTVASGLSIMSFGFINHETRFFVISMLTFAYGFMTSIQYSCMNGLAYSDIPQNGLSSATSITATVQQLSQSIGVAISAIFLIYFGHTTQGLTESVFYHTFWAIGLITIASTIVFIRLQHEDGHQMISQK